MFKSKKMRCNYRADCLGVNHKSLEWLHDYKFEKAWGKAEEVGLLGWPNVPDIRWRAHIALWAAKNALNLEGDFVECGVFTGLLSLTICHYLDFSKVDKNFYLFDVWGEIPLTDVSEKEKEFVTKLNNDKYSSNIYEGIQKAFSPFPNAKLVKGFIPDTLEQLPEKICYASVDLNNTHAEQKSIEAIWPRLTKGAMVVIDDYAWNGHEEQKAMWDKFAKENGVFICTLPTAQGLMIKN